ncbi:hypothetical protein [Kangiella shandongensis]|uniref:hypothetical protein n=1 Tax=Kangiella shandongensis TaxID=2763258 RepID=UPI001CBE60C3|nr:hypothetical protein [Kangiella shandongensis]
MKHIIYIGFVLALSLFSGIAYSGQYGNNTQETAIPLECNQCYSNADFKNAVKEFMPANERTYWLVFNKRNNTLKTVEALYMKSPNPDNNYEYKEIKIISTLIEHEYSYNKYLNFLASGAEKGTLELEYSDLLDHGVQPVTGFNDFEDKYAGYDLLQQAVLSYIHINDAFAGASYDALTITFANGDTAILGLNTVKAIFKDVLRGIQDLPIIIVVDKNGDEVAILTTNGTKQVASGGGGWQHDGGWTAYQIPDGDIVCYGECPTDRGYVTVEPQEDKKDEGQY